jgi:hypothetical protein
MRERGSYTEIHICVYRTQSLCVLEKKEVKFSYIGSAESTYFPLLYE